MPSSSMHGGLLGWHHLLVGMRMGVCMGGKGGSIVLITAEGCWPAIQVTLLVQDPTSNMPAKAAAKPKVTKPKAAVKKVAKAPKTKKAAKPKTAAKGKKAAGSPAKAKA